MNAIETLISIIHTGDMTRAREWAFDNKDALFEIQGSAEVRAMVADACTRWDAPMVWPWGNHPEPTAAQQRFIVALRRGAPFRVTHNTVVTCLACGWVRYNADGEYEVVD